MTVNRALSAAAIICLALSGCDQKHDAAPAAHPAAPATTATDSGLKAGSIAERMFKGQIEAVESLIQQHDWPLAQAWLKDIRTTGVYPHLSALAQYRVDRDDGISAFWGHLGKQAHDDWVRITESRFADAEAWQYRLESAKLSDDFADAYKAFLVLRKSRPDFVHHMEDFTVHVLDQGFGMLPNAHEAQLKFEQYLEDVHWEPANPLYRRDVLWYHYARNLLEARQRERAFAIAKRIGDPHVVATMRADKRFDEVIAANPAQFDVQAQVEAGIDQTRAILASDPDNLSSYVDLAIRLNAAGRTREAYKAIQDAEAYAAQMTPLQKDMRPDFYDQYDSLLANKAWILFDLGHTDEALGVASSVGAACHCGPSTDTALATALFLLGAGKGREALQRLSAVKNTSLVPEAEGDLAQLRVCAAVLSGDKNVAGENMDFLRAHPKYHPVALVQAELCEGDIDGAAKSVQAGLADTGTRGLYLQMLQIWAQPAIQTPHNRRAIAQWDRLRARPDVKAAVAQVGRIERYGVRYSAIY